MTADQAAAAFQQHRGLVFTIAYDITGSVADAEDVTQDVGLNWLSATSEVRNPRAYLARAAAHQALNTLRRNHRRREDYPGEWLPEPLPTGVADAESASPESAVLAAEAVSMALLVVLQSLSEDQRAAFILREVFGFEYAEVAEIVGVSESTARQLVHRARSYVRTRRQRNQVDAALHREVVSKFVAVVGSGDLAGLVALLAPSAAMTTDGGGVVSAARRTVVGAENVARFVLGIGAKAAGLSELELVELNGLLGIVLRGADGITTVQLDTNGHQIASIFMMRNPEKLTHLSR